MQPLISVIGNIFMDVKGFASHPYNPVGKNVGEVKLVHGGVGRNVAETLASLGVPVRLVATVDDNALGHEVLDRLRRSGVDTGYLPYFPRGMGMWLAILDEQGHLAGGISQQPDFAGLMELLERHGSEIAEWSSHIVLSIDLTEEIARKAIALARAAGKPVFGLPGNFQVVAAYPDLLIGLDCFICNHVEAGRLLEVEFGDLPRDRQLEELVRYVHDRSLRSMVVTLGADGSVYYDAVSELKGHQPVFPVEMVDSSGAGDAFFAGTVTGLVRGLPLDQAVVWGTKVAGLVVASAENNCADLGVRLGV
ncbi:carbohydrate kinase family protein [Paenibacillus thermotolerans]|uniref:carbohydrate kinase family protein n=1 Tax=Paenibacillus thermotolerans TaxID=3027807 RepID=UPI002367E7AD|nr:MULTISPECIES: carbohydrate kinase family protein [unclassified Paenibacillus]